MIAIVDYSTGNLRSVENALSRLGAEYTVTSDSKVIRSASHVILPGVGDASVAVGNLRSAGLDGVIMGLSVPVLGICVGMQIMCLSSQEGDARGLGIFRSHVSRFPQCGLKVPHMGWNSVSDLRGGLFEGVPEGSFVYFVHSFRAAVCDDTSSVCDYAGPFSASMTRDNFFGTQFHPEKSGQVGARILSNFLSM